VFIGRISFSKKCKKESFLTDKSLWNAPVSEGKFQRLAGFLKEQNYGMQK